MPQTKVKKATIGSLYENAMKSTSEKKEKISRKEKKTFLSRGAGTGGGKGGPKKIYKKAITFTTNEDSSWPATKDNTQPAPVSKTVSSSKKINKHSGNNQKKNPKTEFNFGNSNSDQIDFFETKSKVNTNKWDMPKSSFNPIFDESKPINFIEEKPNIINNIPKDSFDPNNSHKHKQKKLSYFSDDSESDSNFNITNYR